MSGLAIAMTSFNRSRAYLLNHLVNNLGSFIFGYIYVSIWKAALGDSPETQAMVTYIMVNQSILWVTMFLSRGAYIPQKIKEGTIVFDLLRPYGLLFCSFFEVAGHGLYSLIFRAIPIFLLGYLLLGVSPPEIGRLLPFLLTLFNGFLISFLFNYFVGLWSIKFLSPTAAQGLLYMTMNLLGGAFLPAEYYPGFLRFLMPLLPFACANYYPSSVYLGTVSLIRALALQCFWIVVLFLLALYMTEKLTRSIQVQGG